MSWINNLLKNIFSEPETLPREKTFHFTFKGDGYMSPEDSRQWQRGWETGYAYTIENFTLGSGMPFPQPGFDPYIISPSFGNGYFEGHHSGQSFIIDRDYPGYVTISLHTDNRYHVTFKDGKKIIV